MRVAVSAGLLLAVWGVLAAAGAQWSGGSLVARARPWSCGNLSGLSGLAGMTAVAPHAAAGSQELFWAAGSFAGRERTVRQEPSGSASAVLTALMSAAVPGSGQLRNGSILRGLGYLALEISGWVAYLSFGRGSDNRLDEIEKMGDGYWSHDRYSSRATDPDSCHTCGCPDGEKFAHDDELITDAMESNRTRFYEYINRGTYGCGWDTDLSRSLYGGLWHDREGMQDAQRWAGRLIFLNHLVSAVDAFLEARSLKLRLDDRTEVRMRVGGLPFGCHPEIHVTRHF
jgi:hypothetical protein